MLVEKARNKVLEAWLKGKKACVIIEYNDGSLNAVRLEEILPDDAHYLVDVLAYENPEFKQAVKEMVDSQYELPDKNLTAGEPEYQETEEPQSPPRGAGSNE